MCSVTEALSFVAGFWTGSIIILLFVINKWNKDYFA